MESVQHPRGKRYCREARARPWRLPEQALGRGDFEECAERGVKAVRETFPESRAQASDVRLALNKVRRGLL